MQLEPLNMFFLPRLWALTNYGDRIKARAVIMVCFCGIHCGKVGLYLQKCVRLPLPREPISRLTDITLSVDINIRVNKIVRFSSVQPTTRDSLLITATPPPIGTMDTSLYLAGH